MMPARLVQDLHGAVGRVDALAARAAARRDADLEVLLVDVHVDVVGLRQHGDGRRRRVDAPLLLGRGHALHAVHAALEAQVRVDVLARDERDALLDPARRALAQGEDLDLPALASRRSASTSGRDRAAKSAASSPPSPLRISRIVFFLSLGSGGRSSSWIDASSAARSCSRPGSSACASSRSSGSLRASSSSLDLPLQALVARRTRRPAGSRSLRSLFSFVSFDAVRQHVGPAEQLVELAVAARELLELLDREHGAPQHSRARQAPAGRSRRLAPADERAGLVARERHVPSTLAGRACAARPRSCRKSVTRRLAERDLELRRRRARPS